MWRRAVNKSPGRRTSTGSHIGGLHRNRVRRGVGDTTANPARKRLSLAVLVRRCARLVGPTVSWSGLLCRGAVLGAPRRGVVGLVRLVGLGLGVGLARSVWLAGLV